MGTEDRVLGLWLGPIRGGRGGGLWLGPGWFTSIMIFVQYLTSQCDVIGM